MKTKILIFILLYSSAWADWKDVTWTTPITISSLPYTCSSSGDTDSLRLYRFSGDLSATSGALTISADYIKIEGQNNTLTFDTDATGNVNGITFSSGVDHVFIEGLTVQQYKTADTVIYGSYGGRDVTGVNVHTTLDWIYIKDCNVHVYGHSSMNVYGGASLLAIEIDGGNYTSFVNSFDSRESRDAAVMSLNSSRTPHDTFHFYIHNVTVDSACHTGLLIGGMAWVDSNNVTIDAHNEKPATSFANAHAIADNAYNWAGSRFTYNTIRTGTNHAGGRGMYLNTTQGNADSVVDLSYNDIRVWQGATEDKDARGLKMRWGCQYVNVHHNLIYIYCDNDAGTDYMEVSGHGIWFLSDNEEGYRKSTNCHFYNNEIQAVWLGSTCDNIVVSPLVCFWVALIDSAEVTTFADGNYSAYNSYRTIGMPMLMGSNSGGPHLEEWLSYRDTFWIDNPDSATCGDIALNVPFCGTPNGGIVAGWGAGANVDSSLVVDPIFITGTYDSIGTQNGSGTQDVYYARSVLVTVEDAVEKKQANAVVRIIDVKGDTLAVDTTDVNGQILDTTAVHWFGWSGCTVTEDSSFSTFRIEAKTATDSIDTVLTIDIGTTNEGGDFEVALGLTKVNQISFGTFRGNVKIR